MARGEARARCTLPSAVRGSVVDDAQLLRCHERGQPVADDRLRTSASVGATRPAGTTQATTRGAPLGVVDAGDRDLGDAR